MRESISPEEKLLRLIRGQKKQGSNIEIMSSVSSGDNKFKKNTLTSNSFEKFLPALNINKIILTVFIFSCVYLVYTFTYPVFFMKDKIDLSKTPQEITPEKNIAISPQVKPYEFYTEGLKGRQLFNSSTSQDSEKKVGQINSDLIKDISLIGIISGDTPQAVIEDKKLQKTYYVTTGQFIGQFQVEKILEGKIILNYNGQKLELYL